MSTQAAGAGKRKPMSDIVGYAVGEGAGSLMMNSVFGFGMLYFTDALKLNPVHAGIATGLATFWDAITDPLMGHISDNTRSRYGRRHPYLLVGGLAMLAFSCLIWAPPSFFMQDGTRLFWYVVVINLLFRTAVTVFSVPYFALGFEVCTDYNQRTTLQSVKTGLNMAVNLALTTLVWKLFLVDENGVKGTTVPENFKWMGFTFAIAGFVFVMVFLILTRKYAVDSRDNQDIRGNDPEAFLRDLWDIIKDPFPRTVFGFIAVLFIGVVLLTTIQMFLYPHYMQFDGTAKAIVHGGTTVAAFIGAMLASPLVTRFDKKPAIYMTIAFACIGNITLAILFGTGLLAPKMMWGAIPIAAILFGLIHPMYHLGCTSANTIANSMMADVSEVNHYRTGILKDGSYGAMLTFVLKLAISVGQVICGYTLKLSGYDKDSKTHATETLETIFLVAMLGGAFFCILAAVIMSRYPLDREHMDKLRREYAPKLLADGEDHPGQ